jgi:hypothetical protein
VKLIDELQPGAARLERLRKKPPRLPFFLVQGLEEESARTLVERLREIGIDARVEKKASLAPREVRRKVLKLWRGYGVLSLVMANPLGGFIGNWLRPVVHHTSLLLVRLVLPFVIVPVGALVGLLVTVPRPLVELPPASDDETATTKLTRGLSELGRREDRRLLARLLDRLEVATDLGAGEIARLLGGRAALVCQGLVAQDAARLGVDEDELRRSAARQGDGGAAQVALDRLRDEERQRGALIADLLRVLSRLDLVCLRLARAHGLDARQEIDFLSQEVAELKLEMEADREVATVLQGHEVEQK